MSAEVQRDWVHGLPKDASVAEARVNLTFRLVHA
jgi:hypothetical protein